MVDFRDNETGRVLSETQLREKFKGRVSLPRVINAETQASLNVTAVMLTPKPAVGPYQRIEPDIVEQDVLGNWVRRWRVVNLFEEYTDANGLLHTVADQIAADQSARQAAEFERVKAQIMQRTTERLNQFAATRQYGDSQTSPIVSACSYAASDDPRFGPEGRYCLNKRVETWGVLFQILADVVAGARAAPTCFEDIESELPQLQWPNS